MNIILVDIFRDINRKKLRTLALITTLAMGVSLLSLIKNLQLSMNETIKNIDEKYSLGDLTIKGVNFPIPGNLSNIISSIEGVEKVEPRVEIIGSSIIGDRDVIAYLYGTPPKPKVDTVIIDDNYWTNFRGNICIIDSYVAKMYNLSICDTVSIYTEFGLIKLKVFALGDISWSVSFANPPRITFIVPIETLQEFLGYENEVTSYVVKIDEDANATKVLDSIITTLKDHGYDVKGEFKVLRKTPHGDVSSVFIVIFIPAVLIASILMISVLLNKIISEYRYFGIRKALGFTPKDIFKHILYYGSIIYLLSIPLVIIFSYFLTDIVIQYGVRLSMPNTIIKIDYLGMLLSIIIGFVITMIFSLYPAVKAARTRTIFAIQWGFEPQKYRKTSGESSLPKFLRFAFRNILRRRRRSFLIITSIIIGTTFTMSAFAVSDSVKDSYIEGIINQFYYDFEIIYKIPLSHEKIYEFYNVSGVNVVESYNKWFINRDDFILEINNININVKPDWDPLITFLWGNETLIKPQILEGRMVQKSGEIVISYKFANMFKVKIGDSIKIGLNESGLVKSLSAKVVGIGQLFLQKGWQFVAYVDDIYELNIVPKDTYNVLAVKIKDGFDAKDVAKKVAEMSGDNMPTAVILKETTYKTLLQIFNSMMIFMDIITYSTITVVFIGLLASYLMILSERRWEIGLLKSIGGTWREITKIFLYESLIYATIALPFIIIIGYYSSIQLVDMINRLGFTLEITLHLEFKNTIITLTIPYMVSITSMIPTIYQGTRIEPAKLMREIM